MKTILTGASGFLGRYIYKVLSAESDTITISRTGSNINVDLSNIIPKVPKVDLVVHCAGKAHSVPKTEEQKQTFFDVNFNGTTNLLKGLERLSELPKAFVFISTVAVYGCEFGSMINEDHSLNAIDPYGLSKIQSEQLVQKWCADNNVICSILRLPLLVGKNPPGNLGAMIKGIRKGYYFNIAGGKAKKSMVFAEDVAKIIPKVAEIGGVYNLTDGYHPCFAELSVKIASQLNKPKPLNMPFWLVGILANVGNLLGSKAPINTTKVRKITSDLTFNDNKAREKLNWKPLPVLDNLRL